MIYNVGELVVVSRSIKKLIENGHEEKAAKYISGMTFRIKELRSDGYIARNSEENLTCYLLKEDIEE